jgi:hypothetical protein
MSDIDFDDSNDNSDYEDYVPLSDFYPEVYRGISSVDELFSNRIPTIFVGQTEEIAKEYASVALVVLNTDALLTYGQTDPQQTIENLNDNAANFRFDSPTEIEVFETTGEMIINFHPPLSQIGYVDTWISFQLFDYGLWDSLPDFMKIKCTNPPPLLHKYRGPLTRSMSRR